VVRHLLSLTIASRPFRGDPVSADAWQLAWHETSCRLAVIHGAGSGLQTANAAASAVRALAAAPKLHPAPAIEHCHDALGATRRASILVAQIDAAERRLRFAAVGAVAARLYRDGEIIDLPVNAGLDGGAPAPIDAVDLGLGDDWLFVALANGAGDGGGLAPALLPDLPNPAIRSTPLVEFRPPSEGATILTVRPR
jgi:hypothetical protein